MKEFDISYTSNLPGIFFENKFTILISTYQLGKVIAVGSSNGEIVDQLPVSFKKPMGIALQEDKLAIACLDEIRFFSSREKVQEVINSETKNYDLAFTQRATYNTGILDVHDIEFGKGVLWGVNTLLSCIGVYDINYSLRPKWKPPFIDVLVPEDRCHLNGMTLEDGIPKFATALSKTNSKEGWRVDKMNTGVLLKVPEGDVLVDGLAMPHSPCLYNDQLYYLESGKGRLRKYDPATESDEVVFEFGCFIRGLSFIGNVAVIGKSKIRETSKDFNDLNVVEGSRFAGIILFDISRGELIGGLNYTSSVEEIYDVKIIENCISPVILTDELESYREIVTFPGHKFWKQDTEDKTL